MYTERGEISSESMSEKKILKLKKNVGMLNKALKKKKRWLKCWYQLPFCIDYSASLNFERQVISYLEKGRQ